MMSTVMPGGHPTPRLFVSHSHLDSAFCVKLVADLRKRLGKDAIWYDESGGKHGLEGGDAWWDKIVAEITARSHFLVILSPNSAPPNSKWVPQEMSIAFRQHVELGKRLLPVRLAEAPRRPDWAGLHEFDFTASRPYGQALAELLAALNVAPTQRAAAPAPMPTVTPQQALLNRLTQEAHTAYGRERWSDMLDRTDVLIARQAMTPALWRERASAALAVGDAPEALAAIESALHADPDDIETLRLQGRILLREGQAERAVKALTLANTLAPLDDAATRLPLLADLCDALERQSRWSDLLRRCGDALYLAPQDIVWQRRRLIALLNLGQRDEALAAAQALAARPDGAAEDSLTLARLLKETNAPDEAITVALNGAWARASDAATEEQITRARRDLLAPPPPPIPPERFPARLAALGYSAYARDGVEWIIPPTCPVPAGKFRMGSDKRRDALARDDELNRRIVTLGDYAIGRFPVTVAEYACFLTATQRTAPSDWSHQLQNLDHPVVSVNWRDAFDYAAWLAQCSGQPWRLPTEAEWEKAARCDPRDPLGTSSERIYPWGDIFDTARCNTYESNQRSTTPVGWYGPDDPEPHAGRGGGASPCGAEDMAGNVWEWTASEYATDYSISEREAAAGNAVNRTLRGGSWNYVARNARAAYRNVSRGGDYRSGSRGVRLALSARDDATGQAGNIPTRVEKRRHTSVATPPEPARSRLR